MFGDGELAIAAASGDRDALADIFDRYADGVYELCRVILRDQREASAAAQDTFVIAATRLGGLRQPERLELWLCAIARREAIRRSTKRARTRPSVDDVLDVPVLDETTGRLIVDASANLVWDAAEALTERERSLLVLNVRRGLEGANLADAAGMSGAQASVVLGEAKSHLAVAVRCASVVRTGRGECAELSAIVPHAHAALDALARKRVARHAPVCDQCEPKWNASPDALGVLNAAPPLAAPAALKTKVRNDPRLLSSSRPLGGGGGWRRDGFPPADERPRRRIVAVLVAAVIAVAVAVGLVLASDDASPRLVTKGRAEGTTAVTGPSTSSLLAAAPVTATSAAAHITTTTITTTTAKKRATTTLRPAGAAPTVATGAAPVTTTTASVFRISASGPASMTTCAPARFTASTQGGVSPQLYLHYANGGGSGSKNMQRSGTSWYGDLSIPNAGAATWWVSTDPYGRGGTSTDHRPIQVTACP